MNTTAIDVMERRNPETTMACASTDNAGLPNVGSRLEVYWEDCDRVFGGFVVKRRGLRVSVAYDDGDRQTHDLNDVRWRVSSASPWLDPGDASELVRDVHDKNYGDDNNLCDDDGNESDARDALVTVCTPRSSGSGARKRKSTSRKRHRVRNGERDRDRDRDRDWTGNEYQTVVEKQPPRKKLRTQHMSCPRRRPRRRDEEANKTCEYENDARHNSATVAETPLLRKEKVRKKEDDAQMYMIDLGGIVRSCDARRDVLSPMSCVSDDDGPSCGQGYGGAKGGNGDGPASSTSTVLFLGEDIEADDEDEGMCERESGREGKGSNEEKEAGQKADTGALKAQAKLEIEQVGMDVERGVAMECLTPTVTSMNSSSRPRTSTSTSTSRQCNEDDRERDDKQVNGVTTGGKAVNKSIDCRKDVDLLLGLCDSAGRVNGSETSAAEEKEKGEGEVRVEKGEGRDEQVYRRISLKDLLN